MPPQEQSSKAVWTRPNTPGDRLEQTASRYFHSYLWSPKGEYCPQQGTVGWSCKTGFNSLRAFLSWRLPGKFHIRVQDQRSHEVQFILIQNCHLYLCIHVVSACKYILFEFKLATAPIMPLCCTCHLNILKQLDSGWPIRYIYWVVN
jgi:hypothetical protein